LPIRPEKEDPLDSANRRLSLIVQYLDKPTPPTGTGEKNDAKPGEKPGENHAEKTGQKPGEKKMKRQIRQELKKTAPAAAVPATRAAAEKTPMNSRGLGAAKICNTHSAS